MAKAKQGRKEEDVVYVGIEDPVSVRKDILEASKSLVHVLKGQHNLSGLRAAKHKMIEELRGRMAELARLIAEAKGMLPNMENSSLPAEEKPVTVSNTAGKKPRPAAATEIESHMDKFERELNDIEQKLKSL